MALRKRAAHALKGASRGAVALATALGGGSLAAIAAGGFAANAASASTNNTVWVTNSLPSTSTVTAYTLPTSNTPANGAAPTATLQAASGSGPTAVAFDSAGNLWVAEYDAGDIYKIPAGSTTFPTTPFATGLVDPVGIGVDTSGNVWVVCDGSTTGGVAPSLLEFKSGSSTPTTIASGTAALGTPGGLTIDPGNGNPWVSDTLNNAIKEFTASGGNTPAVTINSATITGTATTLANPTGMTFQGGNLWVANRGANQVIEFQASDLTHDNSPLATTTLSNDGPYTADGESFAGTIYGDASVAFDAAGDLWVANESAQGTASSYSVVEFAATQIPSSGSASPFPVASTLDDMHSGIHEPSDVVVGPAPASTGGSGGSTGGGSTGGGSTGGGSTGGGSTGGSTGGGSTGGSSGGGGAPAPSTPAPTPVVVTPAPAPQVTPPAPTQGPTPQGITPSLVGSPSSAIVQAGLSTTLSAVIGSSDISMVVPSGALPAGAAVSIYPMSKPSAIASGLTRHQVAISAFAVTWQAMDASTPAASSPAMLTIMNPGISAGDTVYAYSGGKLTAVAKAATAGLVKVSLTKGSTLLLAQSPKMEVVRTLGKLTRSSVQVHLACIGGASCVGTGELTVVRKIDGHLRHVVLAASRIGMVKGSDRMVGFRLNGNGRAALLTLAKGHTYRMTLTLKVSGGHRVTRGITIRSNGALR